MLNLSKMSLANLVFARKLVSQRYLSDDDIVLAIELLSRNLSQDYLDICIMTLKKRKEITIVTEDIFAQSTVETFENDDQSQSDEELINVFEDDEENEVECSNCGYTDCICDVFAVDNTFINKPDLINDLKDIQSPLDNTLPYVRRLPATKTVEKHPDIKSRSILDPERSPGLSDPDTKSRERKDDSKSSSKKRQPTTIDTLVKSLEANGYSAGMIADEHGDNFFINGEIYILSRQTPTIIANSMINVVITYDGNNDTYNVQ